MFSQVQSFLSDYKNLHASAITMQSSFTLDLGLTSYDLIEMCAYLEDQFQVEIADEVLPTLTTVGDLVHYLEKEKNFEKEKSFALR